MTQNKQMTFFQFLWKYVKKFKISIFFIFFLYSFLAIERVYFPYLTGEIIDILTKLGDDRGNYWVLVRKSVFIMMITILGMDLMFRLQELLNEYYMPRFKAKIREDSFEYVMGHSNRFFSENHAGSVAGKLNDLVDTSISIMLKLVCVFVPIISTIIISILSILFINIKIGLVFTSWMCIYFAFIFATVKFIESRWGDWSNANNMLRGKIVDTINNISGVRLFSKFKNEIQYCKKYQDDEINKSFRAGLAGITIRFVLSIVSAIGIGGVIYFSFSGWKNYEITTGNIAAIFAIAMNSVLLVWWMAYESLFFFMDLGKAKQAMFVLNEEHEVRDIENAKDIILNKDGSEIRMVDMSFGYNGKKFFERINLLIPHGQKIGLVGFSGAGKTTFANLILREFNLDGGQILIDNQDISKVTLKSLHENISYIAQDTTLFHRSIMENIRFARSEATDEEIFEASRQACCHDFIIKTENGYDTIVGERGAKLSGGQRQRISIARAILKNAPIIILDEATSALDSITEAKIKEAIARLTVNKTTIIIAHRLSTLKEVDRILVFDEGKIIEDGSHEDLMKIDGGYYKKLWETQNDLYDRKEEE